MGFLNKEELKKIGFKHIGNGVKVSNKASFYNPKNISIGDYSRIDDFCVLSAGEGIYIGKYVHIAVYVSIIGQGRVKIEDFSGLSSRVAVYSSNDDYSGNYMTNPTVDSKFTNVTHGSVLIEKHAVVGSGSIILPNSVLEQGAGVGALSLVKGRCKSFFLYAGIPAKPIKKRSRKLLKLEQLYIKLNKND